MNEPASTPRRAAAKPARRRATPLDDGASAAAAGVPVNDAATTGRRPRSAARRQACRDELHGASAAAETRSRPLHRLVFLDRVREMLDARGAVLVGTIDFDALKAYNVRHGIERGDALVRRLFAAAQERAERHGWTLGHNGLACLLVLAASPDDDLPWQLEQMRESFGRELLEEATRPLASTLSAAVVLCTDRLRTANECVGSAFELMRAAKVLGGNLVLTNTRVPPARR